jgi:photosystem II stability/assembly factor-like uncharacterized protein
MALLVLFISAAQAQNGEPQRPDYHRAADKFRAMTLQDENGKIPPNALVNAVRQKQQMQFDARAWPGGSKAAADGGLEFRTAGIDTNSWTWLGPGNIGGRMRSILIHPSTPNTMWIGGVDGGVWKTLNGGASWFPLNDFMANLAVVSLVMDPTDANTIYAGTGEGTSNIDAIRGAGIFKTTDGGASWTQLSATANSSFYYVNRLAICPTNHLIVLAATGTGIWRSTDGGTSWSQTYSTRAMLDIAFDPTGANAIASGSTFGATAQALYSTDGGLTWTAATGIPTAGRIEVAYAASSPNIVYASANNNSGEVYISTDGGVTYTYVSNPAHLSGQGWYDNCIWVDPTNPSVVVVGGTDLYRSTDSGNTWTDIGGYSGSVHPDQHAIVSTPGFNGTTVRTVFVGNDGGLFRATDIYGVSSGSGWTKLNNNLGITQLYGAAGNNSSGTIVGGAQDNGTLRDTTGGETGGWTSMFGGDGGFCAADQSDPNYFYGEYVYLQIHRSSNGGLSSSYITSGLGDAGIPGQDGLPPDSKTPPGSDPDGTGPDGDPDTAANFIAPFILDPNNFNTMLAGGNNLWRSVNVKAATPTWSNIKTNTNGSFISAIAVAKGNSDIIWVGHNNGDVYSTANGTAANPTWTRQDLGTPNLPNRTCTRLTIDPNNFNKVYATFGGFNSDNVYRTTDGGTTWANIASGLPSAPVRSLVLAPFNSNFIYVGTDVGVFASADGGASWSAGNEGAANVAVDELFWMNSYLVAATHGRGLFKILVSQNPVINLVSASLTSENCPPGNSVIDPGETVSIDFTLTNLVSLATTNLVATLLPGNGVFSPGAPQNYGALIAGGAAATHTFSLVATGACGGSLTATLQLNDGTNNLGTVSASFPMGVASVPFATNFDGVTPPAFPAGWTVIWTGAGAAWVTTSSVSDSAPNSAFAPDPASISDNKLTSPSFIINTATAQLTFRHNYNSENTYDGGVLEISINGGAFTDILTAGGSFGANGYSQTISSSYGNPLAGRQAWSGNSAGFITTTVNLPAGAAGQSVQLRWRFGSDSSVNVTGWYVDSISVKDGYVCCVGQPMFQSITRSGGNVSLVWNAIAGVAYRIQYKTNLLSTGWTDVAGDVTAGGPLASKMDVGVADAQRFYRIRVLP